MQKKGRHPPARGRHRRGAPSAYPQIISGDLLPFEQLGASFSELHPVVLALQFPLKGRASCQLETDIDSEAYANYLTLTSEGNRFHYFI